MDTNQKLDKLIEQNDEIIRLLKVNNRLVNENNIHLTSRFSGKYHSETFDTVHVQNLDKIKKILNPEKFPWQ